MQVAPLDAEIIKSSLTLMEKHKLELHPAIHIATCLANKEKLLSFNRELDKIGKPERIDPYQLAGCEHIPQKSFKST